MRCMTLGTPEIGGIITESKQECPLLSCLLDFLSFSHDTAMPTVLFMKICVDDYICCIYTDKATMVSDIISIMIISTSSYTYIL